VNDPADPNAAAGNVTPEEVERLYTRLNEEAESGGYHLNPNRRFTLGLIEGMMVNERRYGYWACPCRLASGVKKEDLDIICPCDYRDADVAEHGACYCGLYVSQEVVDGKRKAGRVPERRPSEEQRMRAAAEAGAAAGAPTPAAAGAPPPAAAPAQRMSEPSASSPSAGQEPGATPPPQLPDLAAIFKYPLWRCRVCGYLCSRGQPPEVCPICRAKKERFERLV